MESSVCLNHLPYKNFKWSNDLDPLDNFTNWNI